jgi:hypothetical protein
VCVLFRFGRFLGEEIAPEFPNSHPKRVAFAGLTVLWRAKVCSADKIDISFFIGPKIFKSTTLSIRIVYKRIHGSKVDRPAGAVSNQAIR